MRIVAVDAETHLIKPGQAFPKPVCLSWAEWTPTNITSGLLDRLGGLHHLEALVLDPDVVLVGHELPYDLGVFAAEAFHVWPETRARRLLRGIFDKIERGHARDTGIRQKLLDIAAGVFKFEIDENGAATKHKYSLADLIFRYTGKSRFHQKRGMTAPEFLARFAHCRWGTYTVSDGETWRNITGWVCPLDLWPEAAKLEPWRLRYSMLDGVPIEDWPEPAKSYALEDSVDALEVYNCQAHYATQEGSSDGCPPDEARQEMAAWVLRLMAGWGVRTDGAAVAQVKSVLQAEWDASVVHLQAAQIVREDGTRDMKAIQARVEGAFLAQGLECPLTDGGASGNRKPKTDEETLRATGDAPLIILADAMSGAKLLNTYIPVLEGGIRWPITSRPNALVDTGRTSWAGPNLQNPPRKGGIRECFIPRPGWVFCSVDYDTIELRALAQTCLELFGWSEMAAALRAGKDLHLDLAAEMLGITYDEAVARYKAGDPVVEDARQGAKAANFGFPGGMGVDKFLATQADLIKKSPTLKALSREDLHAWGRDLRDAWMRKWPEMRDYFSHVSKLTADTAPCRVVHPWSGRVRGGLDYCSAANGYFQGRTADGAKLALWRVCREMYLEESSPLYQSRMGIFLHDEIFSEMPENLAHAAAARKVEIMKTAMAEVIPDVPITAGAVLMRRWYKGAKAREVNGRLVPVRPDKDAEGRGIWVPDLPGAPQAAVA